MKKIIHIPLAIALFSTNPICAEPVKEVLAANKTPITSKNSKEKPYFIKIKGFEIAKLPISHISTSKSFVMFWRGNLLSLVCPIEDLEYALVEGERLVGEEYLKKENATPKGQTPR